MNEKKELEIEVKILCFEMIAFEEMTAPEEKAQKRPEVMVRILKDAIYRTRELALKSQQERLVGEIEKHCYESEEKEQDFCALQGRIGLRNEIIALIKKTYGQN